MVFRFEEVLGRGGGISIRELKFWLGQSIRAEELGVGRTI